MKDHDAEVGCRILSDGDYGTVRYKGEVPPTKGVWLGLEWDDPKRGKHDGSHEGHRYFTTKYPTSGSFLRPKKADFGVTLLEGLQERYGRIDDDSAGVIEEDMYVMGRTGQQTVVEVVGAKSVNLQQSQFEQLKEVVLRGERVSSAGEDGSVGRTIPNVEVLELSRNLLATWEEVARITCQLPKLKCVGLSENRLKLSEDVVRLKEAFKTVETLFMNRMDLSWSDILSCGILWPQLAELHICFNQITTLVPPTTCLQNLLLLNLESNPILDWEQVLALGHLPRLATLIVNDTGIEKVTFPDVPAGAVTALFQKLSSLSLSKNKIADWESMNELHKLASLSDIKLSQNPIMTSGNHASVWQMMVAKMRRVKVINRSHVTLEDRKGAEIDYMKQFGAAWKDSGGHQDPAKNNPSTAFLTEHPRYMELVEKYGAPEDAELVQQSTALKSKLIKVQICNPQQPNKAPITKKLPGTMTVQKLRMMIQRLLKADPASLKLMYKRKDQEDGPEIEFDNDFREISFYAIEEGDTVLAVW